MKKPKRAVKYPNKPKSLMRRPSQDALKNAAKSARYEPSQYHCPENGRYASRVKPASRCDHFHRAKDAPFKLCGNQSKQAAFRPSGLRVSQDLSGTRLEMHGTKPQRKTATLADIMLTGLNPRHYRWDCVHE